MRLRAVHSFLIYARCFFCSVAAPQATLVVLGGGDDDPLLALLAGLLPDHNVPIEVLTTATRRQPARTAAAYAHAWHQLGCPHVRHLRVDEDHPADAPATLDAPAPGRGCVFHERRRPGAPHRVSAGYRVSGRAASTSTSTRPALLLAGTSAGASPWPSYMLVDGHGWRSLLGGRIEVLPGLGLLPGVLLDQHFAERARYARLMHAVLAQPAPAGHRPERGNRPDYPARPARRSVRRRSRGGSRCRRRHATTTCPACPMTQSSAGTACELHLLVAGQQLDLTTRAVQAAG